MTTQLIEQKTGHGSCAGCVAAMATGSSFDDVVSFTGHDGSERGFTLLEVSSFLNAKGYWMGTATTFSYPVYAAAPLDEIYLSPELRLSIDRLAKEYNKSVNELLERAVLNLLESVGYKVSERTAPSPAETGRPGQIIANIGHRLHGFNTFISIKGQPAYVIVGGSQRAMHALYWDGFYLWDSACSIKENPVHWRYYTVYGFLPICRLGARKKIDIDMRKNNPPERFRNRKEALLWLQSRGQISQGKFYQDCKAGHLTIYPDKSLSKFMVAEYAEKVFRFARPVTPLKTVQGVKWRTRPPSAGPSDDGQGETMDTPRPSMLQEERLK